MTTIYCSCDVIADLRPNLQRLNQVYAVNKGETEEVLKKLYKWFKKSPNNLSSGSRTFIESKFQY